MSLKGDNCCFPIELAWKLRRDKGRALGHSRINAAEIFVVFYYFFVLFHQPSRQRVISIMEMLINRPNFTNVLNNLSSKMSSLITRKPSRNSQRQYNSFVVGACLLETDLAVVYWQGKASTQCKNRQTKTNTYWYPREVNCWIKSGWHTSKGPFDNGKWPMEACDGFLGWNCEKILHNCYTWWVVVGEESQ